MATKNSLPIEQQILLPSFDDVLRIGTDDNKIERPEELEGQIHSSQVKKACENVTEHLKILVTGKTSSGKSTLVNGILGVTLPQQRRAKEENSINEACTTELTAYYGAKGDVDITVWDSPGLQDGTGNEQYLQQMKEKCGERDLTLYCIDVRQTRFLGGNDNPDVVAMKKLTREFGLQFWNNTIIVLTFSNCIADDIHIKYLPLSEKLKAVEDKLQEWKYQIVKILVDDVEIDKQVAEKILVIPAGHYLEPHLPVCKCWVSNLWHHCFAAISSQEGQLALLKAKFKNKADVEEENYVKSMEDQPIRSSNKTSSLLIRSIFKPIWNC